MRAWTRGLLVAVVALSSAASTRAGPDFAGKNLSRQDLRGRDLVGASFAEANLTSADLTGAKLRGASFVGADLTQAKLDGADCTEADFTDAKFSGTLARGTDFSKANLTTADLGGYSSVRGSIFRGATLRGAKGLKDLTGCDLTGADLRGASLRDGEDWSAPSITWTKARYDDDTRFPKGVDPVAVGAVKVAADAPAAAPTPAAPTPGQPPPALPGNSGGLTGGLTGGLAGGAPAAKAVGTGRNAAGQDWRGRDLRSENLDDANLSKALLMNAQLQEATLRNADLRGADLWGARLDGANLSGADLRGAQLKDAHFTGTNLTGANLEGQDLSVVWGLSDCSFRGADLRNLKRGLHGTVSQCDFRKADVRGAHLAGPSSAYVATCDFHGAVYDDATRWPKGFDVDRAGAVRGAPEAEPGEDDAPPDRLLAADRDPDAPPEGVVKKVFSDSVRDLAGALIEKYGKGGDNHGLPPITTAVRYSVTYTKLTYLATEHYQPADSASTSVKAYPIDIEGQLTSEGRDGSERTDPFRWVVRFYRTDNDGWKCAQPNSKRPTAKE